MRRIARYATLVPTVLLVVGCSHHFGAAQTRGEFLAAAKADTPFHGTESMTVARPFNAVVADVKAYAGQCLNVTKTRGPGRREAGSTLYYRTRVETPRPGLVSVTLQSENRAKAANNGAPPGGLYLFAADIRPGKRSNTLLDLYYVGAGYDASEYLKPWVNGGKRECPEF